MDTRLNDDKQYLIDEICSQQRTNRIVEKGRKNHVVVPKFKQGVLSRKKYAETRLDRATPLLCSIQRTRKLSRPVGSSRFKKKH